MVGFYNLIVKILSIVLIFEQFLGLRLSIRTCEYSLNSKHNINCGIFINSPFNIIVNCTSDVEFKRIKYDMCIFDCLSI